MKIPFLILIMSGFFFVCKSQSRVDLEKLTFNEDVKTLINNKRKSADRAEGYTTLPAYLLFDIDGFNYGPVLFTNGGAAGNNDQVTSDVSFLLNSIQEKKIVGLIINIEKPDEAKKFNQYINQKYGSPKTLAGIPQPDKSGLISGFPSYLWKNIHPGISMVVINKYSINNNKQAFSTKVFILKNNAATIPKSNQTVLDRVVQTGKK